jgi:hypothetical protein
MDLYGNLIVASSRREEYAREAAEERLARSVRRRHHQAEPRPAPAQREVARPAIA